MDLVFPAYAPGVERMEDALRVVARQGVRLVEWGLGSPQYFDDRNPGEVRAVREAFRETGVRPNSIHTQFGERYDMASLDPAVRAGTLAMQRHALALARELSVPYLIVHPGHGPRGERIAERLALAEEMLRELEPLARAAGVVLAVENLPPAYPGGALAEVLGLVRALDSPHVRVCFDAGHAHLCGDLPGLARQLLPYTVTIHLHDNHGEKDEHLLPGLGSIAWGEFARVYAETGCRAPAMLECAPPEGWGWDRCAAQVRQLLAANERE